MFDKQNLKRKIFFLDNDLKKRIYKGYIYNILFKIVIFIFVCIL